MRLTNNHMYNRYLVLVFLSGFIFTACSEDDSGSKQEPMQQSAPALSNGVVYQEAIYKNWPYTEAAVAATSEEMVVAEPEAESETVKEEPVATESVTHTINAQARIFKPDTLYINPGDSVHWVNMTSHNTVSVDGLIPEGAKSWRGQLGENLQVKLDVEGIYAFVCEPHIGFGMVGVIVVGKPANLEQVIQYAQDNLEGPYRRLIGKLTKVKIPE